MTEKEKMLAGKYYLGWDTELIQERETTIDLLFDFNNTRPTLRTKREEIIKKILGRTGENCWVESPFFCDHGYNIIVGENFFSATNCVMLDCGRITIGDNVLIGPNVGIYTVNHAFNSKERAEGYERSLPVSIGHNVWIGGNVSILGGVTIGNESIIAAGSVVTKDIPSGVIAAGNPAKVLRKITDNDKIQNYT